MIRENDGIGFNDLNSGDRLILGGCGGLMLFLLGLMAYAKLHQCNISKEQDKVYKEHHYKNRDKRITGIVVNDELWHICDSESSKIGSKECSGKYIATLHTAQNGIVKAIFYDENHQGKKITAKDLDDRINRGFQITVNRKQDKDFYKEYHKRIYANAHDVKVLNSGNLKGQRQEYKGKRGGKRK